MHLQDVDDGDAAGGETRSTAGAAVSQQPIEGADDSGIVRTEVPLRSRAACDRLAASLQAIGASREVVHAAKQG